MAVLGLVALSTGAAADPLVDERCLVDQQGICVEVYVDPTNGGCRLTLFVWPKGGIWCFG